MDVFGNIFRKKRFPEHRKKGIQRRLKVVDLISLKFIEKKLQEEYNRVL